MSFNLTSVRAFAETENGTEGGKYVSDVFIAYGKSEKKAAEWLKNNGWEPVAGDFNAGKASFFDDKGNQKKNIDFKTYEYYEAVKCNRPEVGEIGDWQDGVKKYKGHNCFDIADLNADMGQEWLALYTVRSQDKGDPILADTLTIKYGKDKSLPEKCTKGLHLFTYTNAVDLGDTAWAFNNDKKGVRFYWGEDKGAFETTASSFGAGQLALAGIGGLILGILGSSLILTARRRKKESPIQNETTA